METIKEESIKEETINGSSEKNMYEKIANLIKSLLPKQNPQDENTPEEENPKEKLKEYKDQINEYKRLLKENESLNLLKSNGLDEGLKDLIAHHPNPKEAVAALKSFKEESLKKSQEIPPLSTEEKQANKLYMFDSIGER